MIPLPPMPRSQSTSNPAPAAYASHPDAERRVHRPRENRQEDLGDPDTVLPALLSKIAYANAQEATVEPLQELWNLTVLTRDNHAANQLEIISLGGLEMIVNVVQKVESGSASVDDAAMGLLVLENLSGNPHLQYDLTHHPVLLPLLVRLIDAHEVDSVRINAAKILVNLSSPRLQHSVRDADALKPALKMLSSKTVGVVRQGAWLLSYLTAVQGCPAREEVASDLNVFQRLKELLLDVNGDRITHVRAAEVLYNLARLPASAVAAHANMETVGLAKALLTVINPQINARRESPVVAPALLALAALTTASHDTALGLLREKTTVAYVAGVLYYSNAVTRDYDMSRVLMSAHVLVYALGTFAIRNSLPPLVSTPMPPPPVPVEALMWTDEMEEIVKEAGYASFAQALRALGLQHTRCDFSNKLFGEGSIFIADISHQVNVELLPLLRHRNPFIILNATARLYQVALCLAKHDDGRRVLANTELVLALMDLLAEGGHSGVLQAALSLVDVLGALPEVVPLLLEQGILDVLEHLTGPQTDSLRNSTSGGEASTEGGDSKEKEKDHKEKQERGGVEGDGIDGEEGGEEASAMAIARGAAIADPLVKLLAERALMTMYIESQRRDKVANLVSHEEAVF